MTQGQQEGTALADAPAADAPGGANGSENTPNPSDFDSRFIADPAWGLAEFKKIQSSGSRAQQALKKADLAVRIAETLGGGDPEAGAQVALDRLQKFEQFTQNPQLSKILDEYNRTGRVPGEMGLEENGVDDPFDETAPLKRELEQLRQTVTQMGTQGMESRVKSAISDFIEKGDGQHLTPDERSELAQAMVRNVGTWMSNPDTAARVRNLSDSDVELMAIKHLRETGRLESLYERKHLQKLRQRGELATDGPSSVAPGGVSNIPADVDSWDSARVLDWAQKNFSS